MTDGINGGDGHFCGWQERSAITLPLDGSEPTVDVFLPSCSEPLDIVQVPPHSPPALLQLSAQPHFMPRHALRHYATPPALLHRCYTINPWLLHLHGTVAGHHVA